MNDADEDRTAALGSGARMPLVGLGTWQLTGDRGYRAIRHALDVGYRHIDTATMYANEAQVGRALRDSGIPREDVFITTKLPPGRVGRERQTITESLRDLDTGYVDLWLIHWPPNGAGVPTWREFLAARDAGLARSVGVSNYSIAQIDTLIAATGEAPVVDQIPWGPRRHDPRTLTEGGRRGVVIEGYSPFKNANLREPVLAGVAAAHGVTPAQVVLRWHIEHGVVVIPKSATPDRIDANIDVFDFSLSPDEVTMIDALAG